METNDYNNRNDQCGGNCSACGSDCAQEIPRHAKKTIAISGGKGGTGKSAVAALLACALNREGVSVGLLDADITGPSIPHMFGYSGPPISFDKQIVPAVSDSGIKFISFNLISKEPDAQVIWPGADISNVASFFWTGAVWDDPDCIIIDMPSGAGDVSVRFFYTLPIDGVIMVESPGKLNDLIARKSIRLAKMFALPIIGIIENMAGGPATAAGKIKERYGFDIPLLASVPRSEELFELINSGRIEEARVPELDGLVKSLAEEIKKM